MLSGAALSSEAGGLSMPDEVNGKLDTLITKVDNIEAILIGGGLKDSEKLGIVSRVQKLEDWYKEVKDDLRWIKRALIGGAITIGVGVFIFLIQNVLMN